MPGPLLKRRAWLVGALVVGGLTAGSAAVGLVTAGLRDDERTAAPASNPASPTSEPATSRPTPTPGPTSSATPTPTLDLTAHPTTDPESLWVVVNKLHPLDPLPFEPADLVAFRGARVRAVVVPDLQAMFDDARVDGVALGVRTAYRSYGQQAAIRADVENRRGFAHAEKYSARPGYSEHQTGLSLDLSSSSRPSCDLSACFADTAEGQWAAAHAGEYGFLVRYTAANAAVTGFSPEGWHLRYVGRELSAWMAASGVGSLEEALGVAGGPDYPVG